MTANYHTHTSRCRHAFGEDFEYVEKAIAEGVKILGFSDHCPNIYNEEYISYYKMLPSELADYCASVNSMKKRYEGRIELHTGLEAEYFPDILEKSVELWSHHHIEYLIIGQHYVDYEISGGVRGDHSHAYMGCTPGIHDQRDRLKRYVDRIIDGISTDMFTYIAHPDLLTFTGEPSIYLEEMYRLIKASESYGTPLEFNLTGLRLGREYPREDFWRLVGECHGAAILGSDAHAPSELADKGDILRAKEYLTPLGVKILDRVELREPFKNR